MRGVWTVVVALSWGAVSARAAGESEEWGGELRRGAQVTLLRLSLPPVGPGSYKLRPHGAAGEAAVEDDGRATRRVVFEALGRRWRLAVPVGAASAAGRPEPDAAVPTAGEDSFELRRLGPDPEPEALQGVYRGAGRTWIVSRFGEFGPGLFLLDLASGAIGPLWSVADGDLLWGATIAARVFPPRGSASRSHESLRLRRPGGADVSLRRLPLSHEEVRFDSAGATLAGTLLRPAGRAPRRGVVLVHGSGPLDRHFLAPWAYFFAAQGLAVLSYDKRGTGASTGDWQVATLEELAADAAAAHEYLAGRPGIDPRGVGLWGISQGGWIVPQVAARRAQVAFAIVHAGAAVTPAQQGLQFLAAELHSHGFTAAEIEAALELQRLDDDVTRGRSPWDELERRWRERERQAAAWLRPLAPADSPFRRLLRGLLDFDPAPAWAGVTQPTLALFGARDHIVPPQPNAERLRGLMTPAARRRLTVHVLPEANHVMMLARNGRLEEYGECERFAPDYWRLLADWLREH